MLIEQLDKALSLGNQMWKEAPADKKSQCMERINDMLDQRIELMKLRDAEPDETTPSKPDAGDRSPSCHD